MVYQLWMIIIESGEEIVSYTILVSQVLMDKMRKNQLAMEQLQTDYNTEKSSVVKLEGQRSMLERQNKELKAKLAEMEAEVRSKTKATIAALESKVSSFALFFIRYWVNQTV